MATAKVMYYAPDGTELTGLLMIRNQRHAELFPGVKGTRADSFSHYVAFPPGAPFKDDGTGSKPIARTIFFKKNPSLHKCDARCLNAKGHNCECSCGGKNHGAGSL
jgi:hypothetical protein